MSQLSRRESAPFLGNNSSLEVNQRENFRKYSSPAVHPKHSMSSLATVSPTKAFNAQSQNLRSPPGLDHHRATSHSPSRRLPLSTVQHQSPKKGNSLVSLRNGEIRNLPSKVPSKIPSPASRYFNEFSYLHDFVHISVSLSFLFFHPYVGNIINRRYFLIMQVFEICDIKIRCSNS